MGQIRTHADLWFHFNDLAYAHAFSYDMRITLVRCVFFPEGIPIVFIFENSVKKEVIMAPENEKKTRLIC